MKINLFFLYTSILFFNFSCKNDKYESFQNLLVNKINLLNENKLLVVPEGTFCPKCQNYFVANKEELEKDILVLTATENDVSFKKNIDINQYSQLFDKYYQPILFIVKNGKIVAHKSLDSNEFISFCSNLLKNDN